MLIASGLKEVVIPESTTTIADAAFYNSALEKIIIPSSVTSIGNRIVSTLIMGSGDEERTTLVTKTNSVAHKYAINNNIPIELDDTKPTIQSITYSTKELTNGNVNVTINANEPIKKNISDNRIWQYVPNTNKKSFEVNFSPKDFF